MAIIHCVGSRDANYNPYCSRVCCMYSLKFAHLVKEKLPDADCYEFYIDMRAFGKGYEEFCRAHQGRGHLRRARPHGQGRRAGRPDGRQGRGHRQRPHASSSRSTWCSWPSVWCRPRGADELAAMLGIPRDDDGWFTELDYNSDPTDTERGGVYVAGVCQGPKDIPDTVAQASAVAAGVLKSIASGRGLDSRASLALSDIEARAAEPRRGSEEERAWPFAPIPS